MGNEINSKTKRGKIIALGGVLLALSIVSLYIASFVPGFEVTFYTISSIFIPIMMIESKGKGGWLLYASCSILALIILPNKVAAIPYIFFFGIYGILKSYIERLKSQLGQIILKLTFFTTIVVIGYNFFYNLFFGVITIKDFAPWILLIVAEVYFVIYDMILSWLISYYYRRIYGKF